MPATTASLHPTTYNPQTANHYNERTANINQTPDNNTQGATEVIILGGVHGVGKSYFCSLLKQSVHVTTYSASKLIAKQKQMTLPKDKYTKDINENQQHLITAIRTLERHTTKYLLDAHFCLLDEHGNIIKLPQTIFDQIQPKAILILTEDAETIARRRKERDNIIVSTQQIETHQEAECTHSLTVAKTLKIPHKICRGATEYPNAISYIESIL